MATTVAPNNEALAAAKQLVRHLIQAQTDNAEHIDLISPLTRSHELLLAAAALLFDQVETDIKAQIDQEREAIKKYRPLVAERVRLRAIADRYELALNEIAYNSPDSPSGVAKDALGDE